MLHAKLSKKTQKYYLYYHDVYGSMKFPDREILNNKTLEMFGGIDVILPDEEIVRCRTMNDVFGLLKLLNDDKTEIQ